MHDVKAIRESPDVYVRGWSACGVAAPEEVVAAILDIDHRLRAAQTAFQAAQSRRNEASRRIGQAKAAKDEVAAAALMSEVEALKVETALQSERESAAAAELFARLSALPNLPADDVPEGVDETFNVELRKGGEPAARPAGANALPPDHVTLGEALGLMDFEAARRLSGARFVVLKGALARLERAIGQFMVDLQTSEHGYEEVNPPLMVRAEAAFGVGHLPKFEDDQFWAAPGSLFHTLDGESAEATLQRLREDRMGLIPTAEVSLTNLVRDQIVSEESLPRRYAALTPCFRSEAGASGRDTRGMIRQHQFWKCELVSVTTPELSDGEHERMTGCAEEVLRRLGLAYRTMVLCVGDMGFSAKKTYDLEVWLPSQGAYREISSCSNCGDFQARRMEARSRKAGEKGGRFVHTLNGSGLAVGRTLVAVMENYQDGAGRIVVPDVLRPYMGGLAVIEAVR